MHLGLLGSFQRSCESRFRFARLDARNGEADGDETKVSHGS